MCIGNNVYIIKLCVCLYICCIPHSEMHEIGPHVLSVCTAGGGVY